MFTLTALTVETTNYVFFYLIKVKNATFKGLNQIQIQEIINLIIKWKLFSSHKLILIRNINALLAKYKLLKIAICVKIVITSSFVTNAFRKKKSLRVYTPTIIKSITFTQKYFDFIYFL